MRLSGKRRAFTARLNERRADEASRDVEAWLSVTSSATSWAKDLRTGTMLVGVAPTSASSCNWMPCSSKAWCM